MEFDQYFSTYRMPPEVSRRLSEAFEGLGGLGLAYYDENHAPKPQNLRDAERLYRGLDQYCATAVAEAFDSKTGAEFFGRLLEIRGYRKDEATMEEAVLKAFPGGRKYGVLLRGLPEDTETKALFMNGLKTLLGELQVFHGARQEVNVPEVVVRSPNHEFKGLPFHRDKEYHERSGFGIDPSPDKFSYLMMASAQRTPLSAPTVYKLRGHPDEDHVAHCLMPDELLISNNKDLKHTTGNPVGDPESKSSWADRHLLRYAVANTELSHDKPHLRHLKNLRDEGKVPTGQGQLKQWLIAEADRQHDNLYGVHPSR